MNEFSIAIHGGAGTILQSDLTPELEAAYLKGLDDALAAGYTVLAKGGSAIDAVTAAVVSLEDCILFNAGRGSVFTKTGMHEMDASLMNGQTLEAGAVAGVQKVKNPVLLAKAIMEKSDHVMLSGEGALQFAKEYQLQLEEENYFYSQFRYDQWQLVKNESTVALDHNIKGSAFAGAVISLETLPLRQAQEV
jgi:L-asparaginase / beta-aspartyl-peptidase